MAHTVSHADIQLINKLYYEYKNKAKVARETGFSAGTVSKYIIPGWAPVTNIKHIGYDDIPKFDTTPWLNKSLGELCIYTSEEKAEMEEFWKELEQ